MAEAVRKALSGELTLDELQKEEAGQSDPGLKNKERAQKCMEHPHTLQIIPYKLPARTGTLFSLGLYPFFR